MLGRWPREKGHRDARVGSDMNEGGGKHQPGYVKKSLLALAWAGRRRRGPTSALGSGTAADGGVALVVRQSHGPASPLGLWLRRLRWPVIALWVLVVVAVAPFASSLAKATNGTAIAFLPTSSQSARVAAIEARAQRASGGPVSQQAVAVFAGPDRLSQGDLSAIRAAHQAVERLDGAVRGLGAPGPIQQSRDGKAALFTISVSSSSNDVTSVDAVAIKAVREALGRMTTAPGDNFEVAVTGAAAVSADSGSTTLSALLLSTLVIVAVILLAVYRSPVLWALPILSAIGAIELARAAAHGLADTGVTVSYLSSAILVVLVFGAASDYALLLVHRYRQELYRSPVCEDAMASALRATAPTLVASAATVTGAMVCLLAASSASLHGLGPVGAISVLSALVAETTLLPALLLVVGRTAFWPRIPHPGQVGAEASRTWRAIGTRVALRPVPVALGALVLLGAACAGLASIHTNNDPLSDLKGRPGSVVGEQLLSEHFAPGAIAPLVVLVPPSEAAGAAIAASSTSGIGAVTSGPELGSFESYSVVLSVPPYGAGGSRAIGALRANLAERAPGALVGGDPAAEYDIAKAAGRDTVLLIPLVLLVSLVVIALLLRALVAAFVLMATTALSFGASFGVSSLIWHYGLGYSSVNAEIPLYVFIFLFSLGVDYNIFLSARVREETASLGTWRGTLEGLALTGGVITAAGVILAATFAALAQLPSVSVTQVGTAIAIGVLLDTLIVRTVLVPALFLVVRERVWWPRQVQSESGDKTCYRPGCSPV